MSLKYHYENDSKRLQIKISRIFDRHISAQYWTKGQTIDNEKGTNKSKSIAFPGRRIFYFILHRFNFQNQDYHNTQQVCNPGLRVEDAGVVLPDSSKSSDYKVLPNPTHQSR